MMYTCFLSNEDSADIYPNNTNSNFTVELPEPLELNQDYLCCLTEINFSGADNSYIICSDIIDYSHYNGSLHPVLRIVNRSTVFNKPYLFTLKQNRISRIQISIQTPDGKFPTLTGVTRCVLQFVEKKKRYSRK